MNYLSVVQKRRPCPRISRASVARPSTRAVRPLEDRPAPCSTSYSPALHKRVCNTYITTTIIAILFVLLLLLLLSTATITVSELGHSRGSTFSFQPVFRARALIVSCSFTSKNTKKNEIKRRNIRGRLRRRRSRAN